MPGRERRSILTFCTGRLEMVLIGFYGKPDVTAVNSRQAVARLTARVMLVCLKVGFLDLGFAHVSSQRSRVTKHPVGLRR